MFMEKLRSKSNSWRRVLKHLLHFSTSLPLLSGWITVRVKTLAIGKKLSHVCRTFETNVSLIRCPSWFLWPWPKSPYISSLIAYCFFCLPAYWRLLRGSYHLYMNTEDNVNYYKDHNLTNAVAMLHIFSRLLRNLCLFLLCLSMFVVMCQILFHLGRLRWALCR